MVEITRNDLIKMKNARESYGMSRVQMADLFGFGINQWRLYETGQSVPSQANARLIKMSFNPFYVLAQILNASPYVKSKFGPKKLKVIENKVRSICDEINTKTRNYQDSILEDYFMNNTVRKSLKHARDIVSNFAGVELYNKLYAAIKEQDIDREKAEKIMAVYRNASNEEEDKLKEAVSWMDSVISDIEPPF